MGGHKTITCSRHIPTVPPPPPPSPEYHITGLPGILCLGDYYYDGDYEGLPSYRRTDFAYYIFHGAIGPNWYIDATKGTIIPPFWINTIGVITGTYFPIGGATGQPFVIEL